EGRGCLVTRIAVAAGARTLGAAAAEARTLIGGGSGADLPLIAPAMAAAADGDTIEVHGGVYREDLVVDQRLALVGIGRPRLFGTGLGTVVTIASPGCELSGFAIEGSGTGS